MHQRRLPTTHDGNGHGAPALPPPPVRHPMGPDALRGLTASEIDWDRWARHVESRRRRLQGSASSAETPARLFGTRAYLAEATYVTFRLEQLDVSETEVTLALA